MSLRFSKMQGLGNDFVVFDGVRQTVTLTPARVRRLADRHLGVGCDQVLLVEPAVVAGTDFRYRIFNADGTEVEQCGNGARCFARFVQDVGLSRLPVLTVDTRGGIIRLEQDEAGLVTVDMGVPVFTPARIPLSVDQESLLYTLPVADEIVVITALSMGNPHAVQFVPSVDDAPVATQGPLMAQHRLFPAGVNAGYAEVLHPGAIRLRVYERGAGETLACGTGACAAVVAGQMRGLLGPEVEVRLPGGVLRVHWEGPGSSVRMTGPAVRVFDGEWEWSAHE